MLDETLLGADVAPGAISTSEVLNGTLSASDLASNSVGYAEIAPDAFNTELNDSGFFYGIADNSIQSNEVSDNSLTNVDIPESTFAPTIDAVYSAGSDDAFGTLISSRDIDNPTNVRSDNLNAGTWVVFAEVGSSTTTTTPPAWTAGSGPTTRAMSSPARTSRRSSTTAAGRSTCR